jgi:hypothetical protein
MASVDRPAGGFLGDCQTKAGGPVAVTPGKNREVGIDGFLGPCKDAVKVASLPQPYSAREARIGSFARQTVNQ